jgi:hypothetical protein
MLGDFSGRQLRSAGEVVSIQFAQFMSKIVPLLRGALVGQGREISPRAKRPWRGLKAMLLSKR